MTLIPFPPSTTRHPVLLTKIAGTDDPERVGDYDSSITNVVIRDMILRNAGKECVRLQHFVTESVISDNEIRNCGVTDFQVEDDGENGEGVCEFCYRMPGVFRSWWVWVT